MFYSQTYIDTTLYTQTQSDAKYAPKASPALTGTATAVNITASGTIAAPTINATTALQYGGIDTNALYQVRAWILGAVDGATGNLLTTSGKGTLSSSRTATGSYSLIWTTAPSAPTAAFLQLRLANGFIQYSGLGSSGMAVRTYNTANALSDASFSVLVFL